jgi:hypothetical protein
MAPRQKLYVITRKDLTPGQQAVQSGHAIVGYSLQEPEMFRLWHDKSNYLCYLSVACEDTLEDLADHAWYIGVKYFAFREPDLDEALTAVCFEPTVESADLVSGLLNRDRGVQFPHGALDY